MVFFRRISVTKTMDSMPNSPVKEQNVVLPVVERTDSIHKGQVTHR
jgi:hypothetical protein